MLNIVLKDYSNKNLLSNIIDMAGYMKSTLVGLEYDDEMYNQDLCNDKFIDYFIVQEELKSSMGICKPIVTFNNKLNGRNIINLSDINLSLKNIDLVCDVLRDFFDDSTGISFTLEDFSKTLIVDKDSLYFKNSKVCSIKELEENPMILERFFTHPLNKFKGFGNYLSTPWIFMTGKYTEKDIENFRHKVFDYIAGLTKDNYVNCDNQIIGLLKKYHYIPIDNLDELVGGKVND